MLANNVQLNSTLNWFIKRQYDKLNNELINNFKSTINGNCRDYNKFSVKEFTENLVMFNNLKNKFPKGE